VSREIGTGSFYFGKIALPVLPASHEQFLMKSLLQFTPASFIFECAFLNTPGGYSAPTCPASGTAEIKAGIPDPSRSQPVN
jgi:hypothetical protein